MRRHTGTHSWWHTQTWAAVAGLVSAREWGRILVVPGTERRGGLWLALSEIDSGGARELECVESPTVAQSGRAAQRDFFQKGN